jgi:hypothetical protein
LISSFLKPSVSCVCCKSKVKSSEFLDQLRLWELEHAEILDLNAQDTLQHCVTCLQLKLSKATSDFAENVSITIAKEKSLQIGVFNNKRSLEGIDYYVENGFYVFTKWHHLKRGYCCKNKCRHCAYGYCG